MPRHTDHDRPALISRAFLTGVFLLLVSLIAAAAHAEPILTTTKFIHNFYDVEAGEIVSAVFEFMNMGDEPAEITSVIPSTSAIEAGVDKLRIEPNGVGHLAVAYNSREGNGYTAMTVLLTTNDPINQKMDFLLRGTVVTPLSDEIENTSFGI